MKLPPRILVVTLLALSLATTLSFAQNKIQRVLLISVDGMHAVDFLNCANGISTINNGAPYCPAIAALAQTGANYVNANTSKTSDSFPGLTAIVTGGSPAATGVYYDVAYSRNFDAPAKTTGNGLGAGPCTPFGTPTGTTTEYEEGIDINQKKLNGGAPGAALIDGGIASIDSKRLVRDPNNGCNPVWPWDFVRVNSIFSVIHQNGGVSASSGQILRTLFAKRMSKPCSSRNETTLASSATARHASTSFCALSTESTSPSLSTSPWLSTMWRSDPNFVHNRVALAFPIPRPSKAGCFKRKSMMSLPVGWTSEPCSTCT